MKQIGIKLADGSFYPILEDGQPASKKLGLTTVMDNQSRVVVDLYRSDTGTMEDAEYIDSLQINNLIAHPKVSVDIPLKITLDENNRLSAVLIDPETGATSNANITLVSRTLEERLEPMNYDVKMEDDDFDIPETVNLENENALEKSAEKSNASAAKAASAVAAVAAGGGLLAKMMAKQNEKNRTTPSEKNSERLSDAMANKADALKDISEKAEYEIPAIDDKKDTPAEGMEIPTNEPLENTADDIFSESNAAENATEEKSPFDDTLPDFSDSTDNELPSFDDDLNLPEVDENPTEEISGIPEENAIDETANAPADSALDTLNFDLPDFAESATESTDSNEPLENTADDIFSESTAAENAAEEKSPFDDMLPDFSDDADSELPSFDDDLNLPEVGENPTEEISGIPEESAIDAAKDAPTGDTEIPTNESLENTADDIFSESNAAENATEEKSPFDDMLPDFSDGADSELPSFDDDLNLPEVGENPTEEISNIPEESAIDEAKDAPADGTLDTAFDDTLDFDLPDFGESATESADSEDPFSSLDSLDGTDKTLDAGSPSDSPSEENENAQKADESEDPFALPDFDKSENAAATNTTDELNELELPDFPEIENSKTDNLSDLDLPDFPETESSKTDDFSEFDLPDFPSEENLNMNDDNFMDTAHEKDDDIFADSPENTMAETGNALDFDGLYDKETVAGTSYSEGNSTAEEIRKKTKIPVLICLVCAVICIIAVVFMLLVVPSKYNLLGKRKADTHEQIVAEQKITESIPVPAPVPESMPESNPAPKTQAKEDEIVIVTEPKIVETVEPEKPSEPEKPKVIIYKIKWGDTLWDIANAYYKNPWRYRMIARYNNIKNPDYIISGTTIQLPQE